MPTVAIKEITEEQDLDVYSHEVGFDLNDHERDVLEAVEFQDSKDAVEWIRHKDNVDLDGIITYITEIGGSEHLKTSLRARTTDELFQEIMRRNGEFL